MRQSEKLPSRWSLVSIGKRTGPATALGDNQLFWPGQSVPAKLSPLLSGLAPNRDHNCDLLAALDELPAPRGAIQPVFSIFASDPFLHGKRIGPALLKRGYRRIVNWPTTAQYGADFAATLDGVNLGPQRERESLQHFAKQQLTVCAAISLPETTAAFMELDPQLIFVTPGFDLWVEDKLDAAQLLDRCAQIARIVGRKTPIILMADRNSVLLSEARAAGASALLTP